MHILCALICARNELTFFTSAVQGTDPQQNPASTMRQLADILSRRIVWIHRRRIEGEAKIEEGGRGGGGSETTRGGGGEEGGMEASREGGVLASWQSMHQLRETGGKSVYCYKARVLSWGWDRTSSSHGIQRRMG